MGVAVVRSTLRFLSWTSSIRFWSIPSELFIPMSHARSNLEMKGQVKKRLPIRSKFSISEVICDDQETSMIANLPILRHFATLDQTK